MSSRQGSDSEREEDDFQVIGRSVWRKLKKDHLKSGFVDGKYLGAQMTKQDGFTKGYETGFHISFRVGLLKGVLCAAGLYLEKAKSDHPRQQAEELKEEIVKFQTECMKHITLEESAASSSSCDKTEHEEEDSSKFSDDLKILKEKVIRLFNEIGCTALTELVLTL